MTMEGMTMTGSISKEARRQLIDEGHRLHMAIVEWGRKHGVWAYRVLTATDAWFEIWDPKAKTLSRNFPKKIREAIASNAEALRLYADDTRMSDAKAAAERNRTLRPARDRFCRPTDKEKPTSGKMSERE